jgi:hypothetical protein
MLVGLQVLDVADPQCCKSNLRDNGTFVLSVKSDEDRVSTGLRLCDQVLELRQRTEVIPIRPPSRQPLR